MRDEYHAKNGAIVEQMPVLDEPPDFDSLLAKLDETPTTDAMSTI
jgi:hypothetical protein